MSDGHCISDPSITSDPDATPVRAASTGGQATDIDKGSIGGLGISGLGIGNLDIDISAIKPANDNVVVPVTTGVSATGCNSVDPGDREECLKKLGGVGAVAGAPAKKKPTGSGGEGTPASGGAGGSGDGKPAAGEEGGQAAPATAGGQEVAPMCSAEKSGQEGQEQCSPQKFQQAMKQCKENHDLAKQTCDNGMQEAQRGADAASKGLEGAQSGQQAAADIEKVRTQNAVDGCNFAKSCDGDGKRCDLFCKQVQKIVDACKRKPETDTNAQAVKKLYASYAQEHSEQAKYCGSRVPEKVAQTHDQVASDVGAAQQASETKGSTGTRGGGQGGQGLGQSIGQLLSQMMQNQQSKSEEEKEKEVAEVDACLDATNAQTAACKCRGLTAAQCDNIMPKVSPFVNASPQPYVAEEDAAAASGGGNRQPANSSYYGF